MNLLGTHLTLLIGPTVPIPASPELVRSLRRVEVQNRDVGRSGFELQFSIGRSGPLDVTDFPIQRDPRVKPLSRVIVVVTFNVVPQVLIDGIVTRQTLSPGNEPGTSTLTLKGQDVSFMMTRTERSAEHLALPEPLIVAKTILSYAQYGLIPLVIPPPVIDPPLPIERVPVQQQTDYDYLSRLARRHGYVFYITPGPAPGVNTAYWGPQIRVGVPQRAITVNMGPETNARLDDADHDGLDPTMVEGQVQDRLTNARVPVRTFASTKVPLSTQPSWLVNQAGIRHTQMRSTGVSAMSALARAQGRTEASTEVVRVDGELDASRYGGILRSRALVGVRGAGYSYDGWYYVKDVTHRVSPGSYTQRFTLTRDGVGSTTPLVIP